MEESSFPFSSGADHPEEHSGFPFPSGLTPYPHLSQPHLDEESSFSFPSGLTSHRSGPHVELTLPPSLTSPAYPELGVSTGLTPHTSEPQLELHNYVEADDIPLGEDGKFGPPKPTKPFSSIIREILFVGVVCVAQFSTQVSLGQTLNLVHVIGDHFHTTNPGALSWFIAGYSLTVGSFILLFGRFGDYFGYKPIFITGLCWFSLWSMIAGVSNYSNQILFVFARVIQGELSTPSE